MAETISFKRDTKRHPNGPHLEHPDIVEFLEGTWERTDEEFDPSIQQPDGSLWMREGANDPWVYHSGKWAVVGISGHIMGFITWISGQTRWFRMRPVGQPTAATAAQPGLWNDRCLKCGKGIYHGLFKTEHEGGVCAL